MPFPHELYRNQRTIRFIGEGEQEKEVKVFFAESCGKVLIERIEPRLSNWEDVTSFIIECDNSLGPYVSFEPWVLVVKEKELVTP